MKLGGLSFPDLGGSEFLDLGGGVGSEFSRFGGSEFLGLRSEFSRSGFSRHPSKSRNKIKRHWLSYFKRFKLEH